MDDTTPCPEKVIMNANGAVFQPQPHLRCGRGWQQDEKVGAGLWVSPI